jgi:hypothetical protein
MWPIARNHRRGTSGTTVQRRRSRQYQPSVDNIEDRLLLSLAVVEVLNQSTYNITASFRWTQNSSWSTFTEGPGQGYIFWVSYSNSLTPQVLYNTTTQSNSQTICSLVQGYAMWNGSGTPPASAARLYQFQNTWTGVQLYYVPPSAPAAPSLTATATSGSQINLSWNSVAGATSYIVDEWINNAWVQIASLGSGSTGYTISGLNPNTTYYFDVAASNSAGTMWGNYQGATTLQGGGGGGGGGGGSIDHPGPVTNYSPVDGSLFGPNGPSYLDVHQGAEGDCWLLASLAEVAARYPAEIQSMFTAAGTAVENGVTVNLYKVRFYDSGGVARYVTVDTELPSGGTYYDHVTNGVLWVALAEKAYVQANAAGYVTSQNVGMDSYDALDGGYPSWALQAITGKPASSFNISPSNLAAAWKAGQLIVLGSSPNANDNLVVGDSQGTHAYAVVNYNASSSNPFELYNPWGGSSVVGHQTTFNGHSVYDGPFWLSSAALSQDFSSQFQGNGTAPGMADHGVSSQQLGGDANRGSALAISMPSSGGDISNRSRTMSDAGTVAAGMKRTPRGRSASQGEPPRSAPLQGFIAKAWKLSQPCA